MSKWLIERGGIQITVNAKSAKAEELVLAALSAMQPHQVSVAKGIKLVVSTEDDMWVLCDKSADLERKLKTPGDLIYHLTDRIVFHIADKSINSYCLHAAAVSFAERALLIPANSGSGKSSFTTWLVANGFDYLTDELILIDQDHQVSGVGRPIQIKSHGIEAVSSLITNPEMVFSGKLVSAVTVDALGGSSSACLSHQLTTIIFPKYDKDSGFQLSKLSSADAGMSLMGNYVNARNLEGHGFREMMAIIRNTPCYSLEYGGFDKLPEDFAVQLKKILEENHT